ncbi:MAG: DUF4157 domain-containing protein [Pseudomonadota bacterium]
MAKRIRIRRKAKRRAPAVRHSASGAAHMQSKEPAGGLMISGAHDRAEKAADAMASRALAGPGFAGGPSTSPASGSAHVHRKCAACEAEDKGGVHRSAQSGAIVAPGAKAQAASSTATQAITSLGAGRPLSRSERGFFEPRFGHDFSSVRVHDGPSADEAARGIDAEAFTHGSNVAFAKGANRPDVMAHELAHVARGDAGVHRKIRITNHETRAPGYPKKSKVTNGTEFINLLKQFPGAPNVTLSGSGEVILPAGLCDPKDPKKPNPKKAEKITNKCLCYMVAAPTVWDIKFFAKRFGPSTRYKPALGETFVRMPTSKSENEYGFFDIHGKKHKATEWSILAHELCGHAQLDERGEHKSDADSKMRQNHDDVVGITNMMRFEKDIAAQMRPTSVAAPFCGESLYRKRGSKRKWKESSHLDKCDAYRAKYLEDYNKKHGTKADPKKYKHKDALPPLGPVRE